MIGLIDRRGGRRGGVSGGWPKPGDPAPRCSSVATMTLTLALISGDTTRTHKHTHAHAHRGGGRGSEAVPRAYAVAVPFQAEARRHRRRRSGDEKGREQRASSRQAERGGGTVGRPWSDPNQGRRHRRPFLLSVRSTISLRCPPCKTAPSRLPKRPLPSPADSPPFSLAALPYRPQRPPPPPPSADFSDSALFTLFRKLRDSLVGT